MGVCHAPFDLPWVRTLVPLACLLHNAYMSIVRRAGPMVDVSSTLAGISHGLIFYVLRADFRQLCGPTMRRGSMMSFWCVVLHRQMWALNNVPRRVPNYTVR